MLDTLIDQIIVICTSGEEDIKERLHDLLSQYEIKKIATGETHPDISQKMNMFLLAKKMEGLSERNKCTSNKYRLHSNL